MGPARLLRGEIPVVGDAEDRFLDQPVAEFSGTAVSMGNPHLVIFTPDVQAIDLETVGPRLERDPLFPNRTNVHFVQVVDRERLIQRTWERGAGITLACGTGACASGVAALLTGRAERKVDVKLPGGHLQIEYAESGEVFMTGPAEFVFEGEFPA
jgi:diaminopimelate epimerase